MRLLQRLRPEQRYEGHVPGSRYFWGDICQEQFRFVRSFAFDELDVSRIPPGRPYRLASTPYVNYWFATADAPDAESFKRLVTREQVDRLVESGGFTIISTHLGKGFVRKGSVDPQVVDILTYVSKLPGWFVPVSSLLEFLLSRAESDALSLSQLYRLEMRHVWDRLRSRIRS